MQSLERLEFVEGIVEAIAPILDASESVEFRVAPALRRRAIELAEE